MLEKILSISCLGILLGYLSGYYLNISTSLIKLSILILIINFIFYLIFKSAKTENKLKTTLVFISLFILFFVISTIRTNILNKDFFQINETVDVKVKVYDILKKENTSIIKARLEENITQKKDSVRNVAIYTFSQEEFIIGDILNIKGLMQNQLILLPDNGSYGQNISEVSTLGKSFDLVKYWNTQNVDYVFMYPKIKIDEDLTEKEKKESNLKDFIFLSSYEFRNYFSDSLKKVMDSFDAGLVMAMIWGDENNISKETNNVFRNSGISHILVLSGYNLLIIVSTVAVVFKNFPLRKKIFASIFFVTIFLLLANTSAPVWRASIMSFYTLMSVLFLKPTNAKLALWITCFMFFIYSPNIAMHDISFHLSFLATLGIIYFYPLLEELTFDKLLKNNKNINTKISNLKIKDFKKYKIIISTILLTVSVNILIAPYLIFKFYYFKFSAMFLSVIVTPLIPLIMFSGFLSGLFSILSDTFMFGNLFFVVAKIFSKITEILINTIYFLAEYFSKISPSISSGLDVKYFFISYVFIFILYNFLKFLKNKI